MRTIVRILWFISNFGLLNFLSHSQVQHKSLACPHRTTFSANITLLNFSSPFYLYVCTYMCGGGGTHVYIWKPEVHVKCLPQSHFTVCFDKSFLIKPGAHRFLNTGSSPPSQGQKLLTWVPDVQNSSPYLIICPGPFLS